ncbi:M48 family metalloprotease [Virgisporangium aurantiacum]|uniref:Peptidase M48 n=1 Tax=Virgisporangium aurantiacum TaxID=175570 RepID=A0A8J4E4B6_9ACTN|nr:M48 family metalloprotease [Virgisporangium aurantiacum]GIJ61046.1 peptidase M48 [Virgisporangium aurantiacum]
MFDHFLLSVVIVPPVFVAVVRLLADRFAPSLAAGVLAWTAATAAVASMANLAVFALHAAAEVPVVGQTFGWSSRVVADDTANVAWVPWLSVALLAAATGSVAHRWRVHRAALRRARRQAPAAGGLVLVPDDAATAFAVPGRPGHVVVTTGMRATLSARQFDALLAHENAHLAGGHHRLVRAAELAAAAHPALRWVARHVGYLVERAADEQAAAAVGSRRTVAHAIGAAALASAGTAPGLNAGAPGLNAAAPGGVVPRRVAELLRPRARANLWALSALPVGLAVFTIAWTGEAIYDLGELIGLAHR